MTDPAADPAPPAAPRVAPGDRRAVGLLTWGFSRVAGRVGGTGPPHLFLTLGRHRRLFRGWLRFAGRLMPFGSLPRRQTELVILRVAHLRDCRYEYDHHVALGRRVGVTAADVDRVREGPDAAGWTPAERAVLRVADELHHHGDVGDEAWRDLRAHHDETRAIELCLLVGHYEMLATTIAALRIQPDPPRSRRSR